MRSRGVLLTVLVATVMLPTAGLAAEPADGAGEAFDAAVAASGAESGMADVLIRVDPDAEPAAVGEQVAAQGGEVSAVYDDTVTGLAAEVPAAAVDELRADSRVVSVEPDYPVVAFQAVGIIPTGVRRIGADAYAPADLDGDRSTVDVDVAVLDTGVDGSHSDLQVVSGVDCLSGSCTAVAPTDENGHGTHVAGTIAARDDGIGVVGVAPGARLHAVRVLGADGQGSLSSLLAGLEWLRANAEQIEVANLSLGCECTSRMLNDAVRAVTEAGVTLVVSAGNKGTDAGGYSPANHPDVIAVAAMSDFDGVPGRRGGTGCLPDADDAFASYSNYGAVVDVVAPGSCINSTRPGGLYGRSSGTSMAAPHVAGVAALHIATSGLASSSTRAAAVRQTLLDEFTVPATDDCGYTDSVSIAPMLHLTCVGLPANSPPTLQVTAPADTTTLEAGQTLALRATADDAEDGSLDGGIVWSSSVEGRLGTGSSLDVRFATAGDRTVTASVTDSSGENVRISRLVRVTAADSPSGGGGSAPPPQEPDDPPSVPQEPEPEAAPATDTNPQLTIVAPVTGGRLVADRQVQIVSRATDKEDGDIRAWVRWRSDRDGDLGAGGTVNARLSTGTHRITAAVTDADDNLVERTVAVVVASADRLGARGIADACPDADGGRFRDVPDDNPHAHAIDCLARWQVTTGSGDGTYGPGRPVTRGQMATFLAAMIERSGGSLPTPSRDHFTDDGGTHEDNINRLAEAGVVRGTGQGQFAPGAGVTREQMAAFLVRAYERRASLELPGIQDRFEDTTSSVHAANINAVAAAGIAGGVAPERYDPRSQVRRDQMAAFIARTLDVLVATGLTAPAS